jgi:hypothetical protein
MIAKASNIKRILPSFFLLATLTASALSSLPAAAARHYSPESTATAGDPITLGLLSLSDDPYTPPFNKKDQILLSDNYSERGIVIAEGTPLEVTAGIAVHEQRYYDPRHHHNNNNDNNDAIDGLPSSSLSKAIPAAAITTVTEVSVFATVNTLVLIALLAICIIMAIKAYNSLTDDDDDVDIERCEQFKKGYTKLSDGGEDDMMKIKTAMAA